MRTLLQATTAARQSLWSLLAKIHVSAFLPGGISERITTLPSRCVPASSSLQAPHHRRTTATATTTNVAKHCLNFEEVLVTRYP
eukprot:5984200-Prymnesium_polylepis.1